MTASTIAVRDFSSGSAKDCQSSLNSSSAHSPHHVFKRAITEDYVYGVTSTTDTSPHVLIVAPAASPATTRNYVGSAQIANTSASDTLVRITDGSAASPDVALAYIQVKAGTSETPVFDPPLKGTIGNAIYIAAVTSASTIYVSAQGFIGE